jgi:hypothetical protein
LSIVGFEGVIVGADKSGFTVTISFAEQSETGLVALSVT